MNLGWIYSYLVSPDIPLFGLKKKNNHTLYFPIDIIKKS